MSIALVAAALGSLGAPLMTSGDVLLCDLNPVAGREQGGVRPVVVVSHPRYAAVPGLFIAVPLTSRDRGLEHHIEIPADDRTGLKQVSYAMTEQVRAMSSERAGRQLGRVNDDAMTAISHRDPTPILRYQGSADRWAIGIYKASSGQYSESELPGSFGPATGTPEQGIDDTFILYVGPRTGN